MILLMGVAGSGKSLQGRLLADEHGYAWISTGEILRVLVTGSRRQEMLKGRLLSDQEMIKLMDKVFEIIDPNDEFVLDGFPRTIKQADWLLSPEVRARFSRIIVFHLFADEDVIYDRLITRGRLDDTKAAIAARFKEYKTVTLPILEDLKKKGVTVFDIDAARDSATIHDEITNLATRTK